MGIVLILFLVALGIVTLCCVNGDREDTWIGATICTILLAVVLTFSVGKSYSTYVSMRTKYDATIAQYKGAITMYGDRAYLDVEKAALVDFRYQGYQANMGSFIKDLRQEIVEYNKMFISKRIMDKHFMFSWLIIAPDKDMKIINMVE